MSFRLPITGTGVALGYELERDLSNHAYVTPTRIEHFMDVYAHWRENLPKEIQSSLDLHSPSHQHNIRMSGVRGYFSTIAQNHKIYTALKIASSRKLDERVIAAADAFHAETGYRNPPVILEATPSFHSLHKEQDRKVS